MSKKKPRTRLETIAETLQTADLRIRIAADLPGAQRTTATEELLEAHNALTRLIVDVMTGRYHGVEFPDDASELPAHQLSEQS